MTSGHTFVITESPLTANNIGEQLKLPCLATNGHIFDYQLINNQIALVAKHPPIVEQLSSLNAHGCKICIATDRDPQGELIAQHIKALTPLATHQRIHITGYDPFSLQTALGKPHDFNERLASEAAYLRVINLRLKMANQSHFLTTTGITLANSFEKRGRVDDWTNHTVEIDGRQLFTKLPPKIEGTISVIKPEPVTTRTIAVLAALNNIENLHRKLQELYENHCISYFRTDSTTLPMTNLCYKHHIGIRDLQDAHYAVHNLSPYHSDLERFIYKQNESAISSSTHIVVLDTGFGKTLAIDEHLPDQPLTPESELLLHLAVDEDSFASTLTKHPPKYKSYFYNGNKLNTGLVSKVLLQAKQSMPELLTRGIRGTISMLVDQDVQHQSNIAELIQTTNFEQSNRILIPPNFEMSHSL
ncbi:toprim domain-containing protein [Vibrio harveyi]|uniref:toprim domain-containing protein n=1 Tax=Vibrio harveyi TaxID=669 RepID=UPI0024819819|nr:toprim domain-containing protein [Vibrio harveyi]